MGWMGAAAQVARELLGMPRPMTLELPPTLELDTAPRPVDRVIADMLRLGPGGRVSRTEALSVAAVLRGRNDLCSIGTLPLRLFRGTDAMPSTLLRQIDPNTANVVTMANTLEDLVFEGIAWWQITSQDFEGYPLSARHVPCGQVTLDPPKSAAAPYVPPGTYVWVAGEPVPASRMIRFDSPNPPFLASRAIRRAILLDRLASTYAANPRPLDYFTDGDDPSIEPMSDEDVTAFLAEWQAARQNSSTGWIPGNVKRADVNTPSPAELQLVELQRQVTLEIANSFGVDPEDLGVSTTSRTYFNAQDRRISKINDQRAPIMSAITDRLSMGDVTRHGHAVRFDLTEYLRADPLTQVAYWEALQRMGAISTAEIRTAAGLSGPPPAAPAAAPTTVPVPAESAGRPPLQLGDITPHRVRLAGETLTLDAPTINFSADVETRTITGTAVPYGRTARKHGIGYEFLPGSLEWSAVERVKHFKDHHTPVGTARALESTPDGLVVTLGVAEGAEGSPQRLERDQLLADAAAGLYDGLSIGVDFSMDPDAGDATYDKERDVWVVSRATLREVSTTAMPAFDDARVTKVAASRTGGENMHCPHCGYAHGPGIACSTFAAQHGLQTQPTTPPPAPTPAPQPDPAPTPGGPPVGFDQAPGRQFVDPTRPPAAHVVEPPPYVLAADGNLLPGAHDFSTDLFLGWQQGGGGDLAARQRAEGFLETVFAVTPANVATLNPNRNRPDLYVDQLEYAYPLYDAMNAGTLTDVTPFVIPKFNTATGLVADHVTGTEPTPGAFTATSQTITPTAVSGKVEVTREAWDQGGNPQMSGLIWRQMTRGYYEALEAYAAAQLAAVAGSIADLTITTGATDGTLDAAIKAALVPLQFVRGGNRFRTVFTQVDLYKALVAAKDTAGRPLYPLLNPQNANGQAEGVYAAVDAHGMRWLPAWPLAATGTVAASSYTFDRDKVHLWASAPRQINLEWRVAWVDVGIWGYKAFGVTDYAGIRELVYDPVV